jgi:hypothetical protein
VHFWLLPCVTSLPLDAPEVCRASASNGCGQVWLPALRGPQVSRVTVTDRGHKLRWLNEVRSVDGDEFV